VIDLEVVEPRLGRLEIAVVELSCLRQCPSSQVAIVNSDVERPLVQETRIDCLIDGLVLLRSPWSRALLVAKLLLMMVVWNRRQGILLPNELLDVMLTLDIPKAVHHGGEHACAGRRRAIVLQCLRQLLFCQRVSHWTGDGVSLVSGTTGNLQDLLHLDVEGRSVHALANERGNPIGEKTISNRNRRSRVGCKLLRQQVEDVPGVETTHCSRSLMNCQYQIGKMIHSREHLIN